MRPQIIAAFIAFMPGLALADESISGQWQGNLGHEVLIAMDVLADGHWTSQTVQNKRLVAEMAGTYEQKKDTATTGTIVFRPVRSRTTPEHGEALVETDKYSLESEGNVLRLVSGGNDVMVFQKQPFAK